MDRDKTRQAPALSVSGTPQIAAGIGRGADMPDRVVIGTGGRHVTSDSLALLARLHRMHINSGSAARPVIVTTATTCVTMLFSWILLTTAATATAATALQVLPPVNWTSTTTTTDVFKIANAPPTVYVSSSSAAVRDTDGITLIPPSTLEFANTFAADLLDLFGREFTVQVVDEPPSAGVYLTILPEEARGGLEYESGQATTEGYELEISGALVQVKGAGARGAWWGTRTLLQSLVVGDGTVKAGKTRDAPAVSTRGFMLDAGRKWYSLGVCSSSSSRFSSI